MASHLIPFPRQVGICIVPYLGTIYRLRHSSFSSAPSQCNKAQPPSQAATGYKLLQNLLNYTKILQHLPIGMKTLQILPNGRKILKDLLKGGKVLGVLHPLHPPACLSMVSSEAMPVNRGRDSLSQIKNVAVLQGQMSGHKKSASEHNFSGVGCNFRVFQGIFPGAKKTQGFSESSRVCWPPC